MLFEGLFHSSLRLSDLVPHSLYESLCLLELFFGFFKLLTQVYYRCVEPVDFGLEVGLNGFLALYFCIMS